MPINSMRGVSPQKLKKQTEKISTRVRAKVQIQAAPPPSATPPPPPPSPPYIKNSLRYIFCGNPCGGTSFTANYLSHCGLLSGHEMFDFVRSTQTWKVGPSGMILVNNVPLFEVAACESSYTAIEWIDIEPMSKLPLIMIVRNPIDILKSKIINTITSGATVNIDAIIRRIVERYKKIEARAVFKFRVEHDLRALCSFLNINYQEPILIDTKRHNHGRINLSWHDIENYANYSLMREFADSYDYPK